MEKSSFVGRSIIFLVRGYQKTLSRDTGIVRFFFPHKINTTCLYYPTCSEYAILALQKYGTRKGSLMAAKRILSCRPGKTPRVDLP